MVGNGYHPYIWLATNPTSPKAKYGSWRPYRSAHEVKIGRTPVPVPLRVLARIGFQFSDMVDTRKIVKMRSRKEKYCACAKSQDF